MRQIMTSVDAMVQVPLVRHFEQSDELQPAAGMRELSYNNGLQGTHPWSR